MSYLRLMAVLLERLGEIDLATVRLATGYCWCTGRLLEYDVVQALATAIARWMAECCWSAGMVALAELGYLHVLVAGHGSMLAVMQECTRLVMRVRPMVNISEVAACPTWW